jgi:protein subunit release factor B
MNETTISQAKRDQLALLMRRVGVRDPDLVEKFVLGSGSGGQKLNKTSSCVYLKHVPTGMEVKCQQTRSRDTNRFLARRQLCERLAERVLGEESRRRMEAERIRRQKRRRSRRQKQRMLEGKHHQSTKKEQRKRIADF